MALLNDLYSSGSPLKVGISQGGTVDSCVELLAVFGCHSVVAATLRRSFHLKVQSCHRY